MANKLASDLLAKITSAAPSNGERHDFIPARMLADEAKPFRFADVRRSPMRGRDKELWFTVELKSGETRILTLPETAQRTQLLTMRDELVAAKDAWFVLTRGQTSRGNTTWVFAAA